MINVSMYGVIFTNEIFRNVCWEMYGGLFGENAGMLIFYGEMCGRKCVGVRLPLQDYKSVRPAVMICATSLVNTHKWCTGR